MRTYVRILHNSEGAGPREVVKVMQELGFEPALGTHDFVYKWKGVVGLEQVLDLIERMHRKMSGMNVNYEVTTLR